MRVVWVLGVNKGARGARDLSGNVYKGIYYRRRPVARRELGPRKENMTELEGLGQSRRLF